MKRTYFKGFNALRFYAALSVVIQHVSYSPHDWYGARLLNLTFERFFLNGTDSVNLFFSLSGFLITYLLLSEREKTHTVSLRNFYLRRIFRIFPVYYLFLLLVLPLFGAAAGYETGLIALLVFFGGNFAFVLYFPYPPMEHLWSIAVEEQYYLVAPVLAKTQRHLLRLFIGFIAVWWAVLLICWFGPQGWLGSVLLMSRYDLIALGGVFAMGYFRDLPFVNLFRQPVAQVGAVGMLIYSAAFVTPTYHPFHTTLAGIAYITIIYNLATRDRLPIIEHRLFEYLGNLSYSLYVYHPFYVLLCYNLVRPQFHPTVYPYAAYPFVITAALLSSALSYRYLERPMLRFKERFKRS